MGNYDCRRGGRQLESLPPGLPGQLGVKGSSHTAAQEEEDAAVSEDRTKRASRVPRQTLKKAVATESQACQATRGNLAGVVMDQVETGDLQIEIGIYVQQSSKTFA